MPWLTAEKYLCHMWPRICSIFRNHNSSFFLLSWRIIGFFIFKGYTTWVTSGLFALLLYTTGVSSGLLALALYTTGVPSGQFALALFVPCYSIFTMLFSVVFCGPFFLFFVLFLSFLSFFILPLYCLSFDSRLLVTSLYLHIFLSQSY